MFAREPIVTTRTATLSNHHAQRGEQKRTLLVRKVIVCEAQTFANHQLAGVAIVQLTVCPATLFTGITV